MIIARPRVVPLVAIAGPPPCAGALFAVVYGAGDKVKRAKNGKNEERLLYDYRAKRSILFRRKYSKKRGYYPLKSSFLALTPIASTGWASPAPETLKAQGRTGGQGLNLPINTRYAALRLRRQEITVSSSSPPPTHPGRYGPQHSTKYLSICNYNRFSI